ncbi:MAG TPA: PsiF family protein [Gammaproteobacteria bacterium]|nr:PsiF family protein [Gammaproteobacteria bacterium]
MKTLLISLSVALAVTALAFTSSAFAQESKPKTPQQQKFADCAHQSKGLKGDEHKQFMSDCLGGKTHEMKGDQAAKGSADKGMMEQKSSAQDAKTKACKSQAKSKKLTGEERKAFMSECLKGDQE